MSVLGKGYQVFADDAILDAAGKDLAVYGVNIVCDSTAGVLILHDTSLVGGASVISLTGTASKGIYVDFGAGLVFNAGCFVEMDAHVIAATVVYERL